MGYVENNNGTECILRSACTKLDPDIPRCLDITEFC